MRNSRQSCGPYHGTGRCATLCLVGRVMAIAGSMMWPAAAGAEFRIHVAADARPGGTGAANAPLESLVAARDAIRRARGDGTLPPGEPATVEIAPGDYPLTATFDLQREDGGTAAGLVVYRAAEQGRSRIHGGVILAADAFRPVSDAAVLERLDPAVRSMVVECDVPAAASAEFADLKPAFDGTPTGPWLSIDRELLPLARWPNADAAGGGWARFKAAADSGLPQPDAEDPAWRQPHGGAFVFADPRPARWKLDEGVWLYGYWTHDWSSEAIRIAAHEPATGLIRLAAPHHYGIGASTWGHAERRFYAFNALEELDAPGEWWLDRRARRIYLVPPRPLAGARIALATLTGPLVKLSGASHVRLVGLAVEHGHGGGIVVTGGQGVEIAGCTVAACAGTGIAVSGSGHAVRSCDLHHLGNAGITLDGGDRATLTAAGNVAENNHIHHYAFFRRTYAPGIGVHGCGQIVRHNRIHDAPHVGVLYAGNEHLFERNELYRVVMETADAGAFYSGRDWTSRGNVLRHNFIHDLGAEASREGFTIGIYLDDCDCGDTLDGNVVWRAGRALMIGGGRDNPVTNNLVVDCTIGLHIDARGMHWPQWNNPQDASWWLEEKARQLNYTLPPWSTRYPRLAAIMEERPREPRGNPILRNVFVDCRKEVCDFDGDVRKMLDSFEIADNLAVDTGPGGPRRRADVRGFTDLVGTAEEPIDLGFIAAAAGDFALRPDARLRREAPAFTPIPFQEIGLRTDEFRTHVPPR